MFAFFRKQKKTSAQNTQTTETNAQQRELQGSNTKSKLPKKNYIFNVNPNKYAYCRNFVANLKKFLYLDYGHFKFNHYIATNEACNKLYEIHTKHIGFEGASINTEEVIDFVTPPRELTIEEFLQIVDSKYANASILYKGINNNNLHLYQDLVSPHLYKHVNTIGLDSRQFACTFKQSAVSTWALRKDSEIYPLVSISEFLIDKGFSFDTACVGGGITEISHAGTVSYSARYSQFEKFRDEFYTDIRQADIEADAEYGGWASIDYRYIFVDLVKDATLVRINKENGIHIEWSHPDNIPEALIKETIEKMIDILGEGVETKEYYFIRQL